MYRQLVNRFSANTGDLGRQARRIEGRPHHLHGNQRSLHVHGHPDPANAHPDHRGTKDRPATHRAAGLPPRRRRLPGGGEFHGFPTHPAWRYNLEAAGTAEVRVRNGVFTATATVLDAQEK